jgi:small subunit ribosomal protein S1
VAPVFAVNPREIALLCALPLCCDKMMVIPMSNPTTPDTPTPETNESFSELLSQYDQSHRPKSDGGERALVGTVIAVTADSVLLDIGYKIEGILPFSAFDKDPESPKTGDRLPVNIKGRDPEGYYELVRGKVRRATDWSSLEKAFAEKATISGTVTEVIKGGVSVDVGVRAFMPASRTGTRDAAEMEKLVGQDIRCRITKLDVTNEDVVVDRRAVLEEEERETKQHRFSELKEGDTVTGTVRNLADYGAFVDIGGVDGLLHVAEISWTRVNNPADVLSVGQQVEVTVLKIDYEKQRLSLGMKQLTAHPWENVAGKYNVGDRVRGTVSRLADFGAFVEIEPGVEGLIHISEMSWAKRVRKPGDLVKVGDTVEAVILGVNAEERRISLGLKQALGDPWEEISKKLPLGAIVEGPVTNLMKFGAFVQIVEGVEGMIHISDITAERRLNHPSDMLKVGEVVKAQVLEIDTEKRRIRLGMKQLVPTTIEEFITENKTGDAVTGRIAEINGSDARVELGEGVYATCRIPEQAAAEEEATAASSKADLSSLGAMLQARWKGNTGNAKPKPEPVSAGQVRSFRITKLDAAAKKIELELAQ